ncbi:hypothetical protein BDY21DRAFT_398104 [Lineolata rhizophorae]|uniref:G-protein coupled receptors family 2 profile 2 domain-containing protein n=1 Tax=Lineolata rhizophorae TaxID=578093 RepID=A0A6A6PDM3_9PEZI|nr:hypothetical protein BDY21DRAFT_398104 [Lineolata rhizophorae]
MEAMEMDFYEITPREQKALEVVERSMASVSLVGTLIIFVTFVIFPAFRKPINRLIVYASFGNVMCSIAALISVDGISSGMTSGLCQFQGFLIQMFMCADSLWTFCMALNVYLTFFKNYLAADLKRLEKWYFLLCYGIPLVPALVFLLVDAVEGRGIYGPATLWCWISVEWDWMRVAFFYGPVWVVITLTTSIYVWTGRDIFKQRAALRAFSKNRPEPPPAVGKSSSTSSNSTVTKVVDIEVKTERIDLPIVDGMIPGNESQESFGSAGSLKDGVPAHANYPYEWQVSAERRIYDQNPSTRCSATVTAERRNPDDEESALRSAPPAKTPTTPGPRRYGNANAALNANRAAWGYAKVSLLMFVAMIIVWGPSTIYRVYSLVRPEDPQIPLQIAAACVLPMQGFWNTVIYLTTSWPQCKSAWRELRGHPPSDGPLNLFAQLRQRRETCRLARSLFDASAQTLGPHKDSNRPSTRRARPGSHLKMSFVDALRYGPGSEYDGDGTSRPVSRMSSIKESSSTDTEPEGRKSFNFGEFTLQPPAAAAPARSGDRTEKPLPKL